jgi:hypothetical protein
VAADVVAAEKAGKDVAEGDGADEIRREDD